MAGITDVKNGLCMHFNHDIYQVVEFLHVKPGKGGAFVRTKLKSLTTGKVLDQTFQGNAKIDAVRVERRKHQFLYKDGEMFNFMNNESFEQVSLTEAMVSAPKLLKDGQEVELLIQADNDKVLACDMPQHVILEVTYTEPGVRGDTATNATKPAKVETGAEVNVPLFINQGDTIKIDTKSNAYVERIKV